MSDATRVIFMKFHNDEVIAIFPYIVGDMNPGTCQSYMHFGQHGACDPHGIVHGTSPCLPDEYADLKKELEQIGYELEVISKIPQRNAYEARLREIRGMYGH